jgi:Outer membrane protein beta-barrel family
VEGQFVVRPYGEMSIGVARQVMNNKATIKLNAKDIWFTLTTDATVDYENVREHFIQSGDTRVVNLSFSYRFGRSGKEPAGRHLGGADEEQNRVKL